MRRRVMLIVETSLAYGRGVLRGIGRWVVAHEPWSMYVDLRELVVEPPTWLDDWDGDGIICRATTPKLAARLIERGLPAVDLTDIYGDLGLPGIWTDHEQVGALAAAHLLERGFTQFGYCGFSDHDWSTLRERGFASTLAAANRSCEVYRSPWHAGRDRDWDDQQQRLCQWLSSLPQPAGVMACNDMRGQHVLDACRRLELPVPEALAVVGVDNDELLCELCDPPLSSVQPSAERVGYEAAALLDRLMRGEPPPAGGPLLVPPHGVVTRQSTDVLAIDEPQVAAALRYIRERACDPIGVADVLRHVPLSRSILERRFRKYLGRSPQAEIRQVQLKRVRQLLLETDLPLDRIANLAGYEHAEYMSVVFKRELGITPGAYRKEHQAGG